MSRPRIQIIALGLTLMLGCLDARQDDDSAEYLDPSGDDDATTGLDEDLDGWSHQEGDCDDNDPTVHPGAEEGCDGIDTDCDGFPGELEEDDDGDGASEFDGDCDDDEGAIHPGATEVACDYLDNDCDGDLHPDEVDDDGDGRDECGGDCDDADADLNVDDADSDGVDTCSGDCDDNDGATHPGADERCDGVDNDCDGDVADDELDDDGDGHAECGGDCDDANPEVFPGAGETCNGADDDCDGVVPDDEDDADGDGFMPCEGDLDDGDPNTYPGAPELCDGLDNDCDGAVPADEVDADGDGHRVCGGDCDDGDPLLNPGAAELGCDYIDNDCDGLLHPDEVDDDGDGYDECATDCDDTDATLNLDDLDGDGWCTCDGDCDDADPGVHEDALEACDDGVDNDCDGDLDCLDTDCGQDPACGPSDWVTIAGGTYDMGSNESSDEQPIHAVAIPTFEMWRTEVTVAQYEECFDDGACSEPTACGAYQNWGVAGREDYPVNCVDWAQAGTFCAWVGGRLPSESEWEYAARSGGLADTYPWGDTEPLCSLANSYGCVGDSWEVCSAPDGNTDHGLCDMSGNVYEWVQDWYHADYSGAPADGSAWEVPPGLLRVARGGSFECSQDHVRAAHRQAYYYPPYYHRVIGFRCAR